MNFSAPLLQEVSPVWSRAHQASQQLPKLEMTGWFPYVAVIGIASSKGKEVGAINCDPVLQSAGLHAEPSPAWH